MRENLELARRLYDLPDRQRGDRVIERLGLREYADRRAGTLSMGNLQRLGLARALLHEPELLVLDEPSNGLDPAGVVEVRAMLRGPLARARGDGVHVEPHPDRGRSARDADRHRASRPASSRRWARWSWSAAARPRLEVSVRDARTRRVGLAARRLRTHRGGRSDRSIRAWSCGRHARSSDPDEIATAARGGRCPSDPPRRSEQEDIEEHFLRLTAGNAEPET